MSRELRNHLGIRGHGRYRVADELAKRYKVANSLAMDEWLSVADVLSRAFPKTYKSWSKMSREQRMRALRQCVRDEFEVRGLRAPKPPSELRSSPRIRPYVPGTGGGNGGGEHREITAEEFGEMIRRQGGPTV